MHYAQLQKNTWLALKLTLRNALNWSKGVDFYFPVYCLRAIFWEGFSCEPSTANTLKTCRKECLSLKRRSEWDTPASIAQHMLHMPISSLLLTIIPPHSYLCWSRLINWWVIHMLISEWSEPYNCVLFRPWLLHLLIIVQNSQDNTQMIPQRIAYILQTFIPGLIL